ncbi:MAG: cyclase family protein [Acidobacteriota bacterium]|nr:cyclase family protein [Acidobacteriota bacterium]
MRPGITAVLFLALTLAAARAVADGQERAVPDTAASRSPRNAEEYDALFQRVKNWGRWGADDQRGAVNLVTDAKRRQAAGLVKLGLSVSLAHNPLTDKAEDNGSPFEHTMNRGFTTDTYRVSYHGYAHSHLDALCHILYKDQTYNGYARAEVNTEKGCAKLGIDTLKQGVITRGVLVDIPRLKGLPYLDPGTAVYQEDVEAWEKKAGVKIGSGDALLLRTGRWGRRAKVGPWPVGTSAAGFHASIATFLKARGVAFLGSDAASEVMPSLVDGVNLPVHTLAITALGINILDNQDLEQLSETAQRLKRWEFQIVINPMPVTGGTGSPLNTLAVF